MLAQQIVAEVAAQEWNEDELFDLLCAAPGRIARSRARRLRRRAAMLAEGFSTRRGRRGAR